MPKVDWDALPLPEKVEKLHRDLDDVIQVEQNNVGVRASQRRDIESSLAALHEVMEKIESRLAALEKK